MIPATSLPGNLAMPAKTIVHVTTVHSPRDVRILEKECLTLAQAGHRVVLVARAEGEWPVAEVELVPIPAPPSRLARMLTSTYRACRLAQAQQPDLIHLHDPELLLWAPWLRRLRIPVVFDMHENVPLDLTTKEWIPRPLRPVVARIYRTLERILLKGLAVVFAEKSYAREYSWVECAETVLNMPRLDLLSDIAAPKHSRPTVAYMGAVSQSRGAKVTLQALAMLRDRGHSVAWECIGPLRPPAFRAQMERWIEELGLEGVHLRGWMDPRDGWPLVARCHAGLAVLEPEPNFVESYPTKLFEYMALGLPVIASDFPLYREVVEQSECGICVDPRSPEALAEAIEHLITLPERAAEWGQRGRQAVLARYNWDEEAAKLLALYRRLWCPSDPIRPPGDEWPSVHPRGG